MSDNAKTSFSAAARRDATWRRENQPDPAKVAEVGIKTEERFRWEEARAPESPALTHEIDQANLRQASIEAAQQEEQARIEQMRERLRQRPEKARQDFRTARDYGGSDRER